MAIYKKILGLFPLMIVLTMIWGCGNHMDKSSESFDITKFPRDEQGYPNIPDPTPINELNVEDGAIVIVGFDMLEYQRKHNSKAVKKTLSIPEWLNEEAIEKGVNFSQVLQEALMNKLNIRK
ncbi:hypothetical protein [Drancourtella sp. An57]|uniref:hypothetical protein n=1 Tax=Drancourtella sp. An57 TaxID=1965647 RepID=UPI001FA8C1BF|nr:hypothetical protein [Drancourtella sp. An57]